MLVRQADSLGANRRQDPTASLCDGLVTHTLQALFEFGRTVAAVKKGGHLHTHNLKTKKW